MDGGCNVQVSWISSMAEFASIITPVLEMVHARRICEIGASAGANSKVLGQFLRLHQGKLIAIDPRPQHSFLEWAQSSGDLVTHIKEYSLNAIPQVGKVDAWFLDGDHNWYTVYHELLSVEAASQQHQYPLLAFLHDMNWPCARRDMYYDPSRIPAEFLQKHSADISITVGNSGTIDGGFKGGIWALHEGGPRNGILTAVEDFIKQSKRQYHWIHVPAVLGLGVLVDVNHPCAQQIVNFYAPYHQNPLIETLEKNRITNYLAVCALNDKIAKMSAILDKLTKFCVAEKA